ncbi:DUF5565 family protein (plasmid) [Deinococcus sp. KNUC1210]|uniref:RNA ligase 1 family protein n=1 Tax=Deinococcus sp. KNUC1210 TaxID=2917691 RepID=UPI001EF04D4F|nr:DUF5565 family protein [Deinococcus sp. KNUC1210]ULH18218.1 DUF5565 family protein [Deinococcus sp. KNUC1210]
MKKIVSLFQRNYEGDRLVRDEIVPGAEWVAVGEGLATRKFDGTSCLIRDGKLYKRYDAKQGKTPPEGFEAAQAPDPQTGHWPGWVPVGEGADDRYHREGRQNTPNLPDGTYELVGPKIQSNSDGFDQHQLVRHGGEVLSDVPRDFQGLKAYLEPLSIEGIVWHHPDGRMVKIKRKDFFKPAKRTR